MWQNKARLRVCSPKLSRSLWCAIGGLVVGGVFTRKIVNNRNTRKKCHQSTQTEMEEGEEGTSPSIDTLALPTSPTSQTEVLTVSDEVSEPSQEVVISTAPKEEDSLPPITFSEQLPEAVVRAKTDIDFTHQPTLVTAPTAPRTTESATQTILPQTRESSTQLKPPAPTVCSECWRIILSPSADTAAPADTTTAVEGTPTAELVACKLLIKKLQQDLEMFHETQEELEELETRYKTELQFERHNAERERKLADSYNSRAVQAEADLAQEMLERDALFQQNLQLHDEVAHLRGRVMVLEFEYVRAPWGSAEYRGQQ